MSSEKTLIAQGTSAEQVEFKIMSCPKKYWTREAQEIKEKCMWKVYTVGQQIRSNISFVNISDDRINWNIIITNAPR